ncbi:VasL domain-containing protein [Enterobacter sp. JJBC]|uniref:VasL domain-containing protein n=1 Tax=Enterobacter sp. JJBC TaxID=3080020 RepID=UPI0030CBFEFC
MIPVSECHLKTGGDPRTLAAWAGLRDELSKLTHPARPDVNWTYAETLCLNLFEHNGVELQTAAWYTLVRSQRAGLPGMNEGLAILEALTCRLWGSLWPQAVHARVEILSTLARRLQQHLRTQVPDYTDLVALYQAEQHLSAIAEALQRLELRHQTGLDALYQQIRHAAVRLENNSDRTHDAPIPPASLPAAALNSHPRTPSPRLVWVLPSPPEPRIRVNPASPWRPFVAGMFAMLVTGSLMMWGAGRLTTDPDKLALMATVAPLPAALSPEQLEAMPPRTTENGNTWFPQARAQLDILSRLSPVWPMNHGSLLVRQAQHLWPAQPETVALAQQWQSLLNAAAASPESLEGWYQGMSRLQKLTSRLNDLDEKKGKYMTVSELKSQIFAITQAFNQTVPVEEQLRQLAALPEGAPVPAALSTQTELQLKQLLARYAILNPPKGTP